ncbi:MAG: rod-binding protein [Spirochaetaceae bacterium]|nr:rod-binding protein [Spirochaetaceae bacterium]
MTVMDIADYQYRNQALKVPAARPGGAAGGAVGGASGAAGGARGAAAIDKKSELFAQCREFESIFVKMMLKEMRASVDKSDSLMSGGWAEDIFQDMLNDEYSKSMANNAGFGIAEQLYRELARA